jgi:type I restriction enzyme S subunit
VEWLGDVPEHWDLPKLKHFATFLGGGTPSRDNLAYWNGDIPWVSPKDMKVEQIDSSEEYITTEGLENSSSSLVPKGHVLLVVRSGILKHTIPVAINEIPVALNQDMKALNFAESRCLNRFFMRWVQGLNDQLLLAWAKQGATVESIEHTYLAETTIPLPQMLEQHAITAFLDRETAKIDTLVAEQQRLIELLKEKRQAVISQAVTKGLNPDAPMKDSGIEWLGEIPAHWEILRIRHIAKSVQTGGTPGSEEFSESGIPWFTPGAFETSLTLLDEGAKRIEKSAALSQGLRIYAPESVLVVGIGATVGKTAIAQYECTSNQQINAIEVNAKIRPKFLAYILAAFTDILRMLASSSTLPILNQAKMKSIDVTCPDLKTQDTIIAFIEDIVCKSDILTAEAQRSIALLQERRTALISAAVTGKIDVRGLAAPQPERELASA